jgi:Tfp pilus assembly protein PilO
MSAIVAALVGMTLLWWMLVYSPGSRKVSDVRADVEQAQDEQAGLRQRLEELQTIAKHAPEVRSQLAKLEDAVPSKPQLAGFITEANRIAQASGVTWVSVSPSPPELGPTGSTIRLSIQLKGGFFQVLDYMHRLERLPRLVVVDSVDIASEADGTTDGTGAVPPGGLGVTLTARIFTVGDGSGTPAPAAATSATGVN